VGILLPLDDVGIYPFLKESVFEEENEAVHGFTSLDM